MDSIAAFRDTLRGDAPPNFSLMAPAARPALQALWWLMKGDWSRAHDIVQAHEGNPLCDRLHAHLHRCEGDLANARYWYVRAGHAMPTASLDAEREDLLGAYAES